MRNAVGFTLIELLVAVLVLGVVASIAIAAYETYVEESQSTVVSDNYKAAIHYVRNHYLRAESALAMGMSTNEAVATDATGWGSLLNPKGHPAPTLAGSAFTEGAGDAALGSIGIDVTGDYADGDYSVTITQPAFASLPPVSTVVA